MDVNLVSPPVSCLPPKRHLMLGKARNLGVHRLLLQYETGYDHLTLKPETEKKSEERITA